MVEAFIGEYASGKSEIAINRALELKQAGHKVTLADLDTVEPFYTLRPLKEFLENKGLKVIGFSRKDSFGLGETGAMLNPKARWILRYEGDIIMDVGYGVHGARTLNLVEGTDKSPELKVLAVVNYTRPLTNSPERIIEYLKGLGRVDGIVANTHLGDETTIDIVCHGNRMILDTVRQLGLEVMYAAVDQKLAIHIKPYNCVMPIKYIHRYMPSAIW